MKKTALLRILRGCGLAGVTLTIFGCASLFEKNADSSKTTVANMAYYNCESCHGAGNQRVETMTPNIIGQKHAYLVKKLKDFRSLKRISPYMNGVVANLTDQDINNLATYYANDEQNHP